MAQKVPEPLLIVEDDPVCRRILSTVAEEEGYQVFTCPDGECGWEAFQRHQPRIVVLDWIMKGMNGVSLAGKIRASEIGRYVTILMVTIKDRPQDIEEALRAGVTYYLVKPVMRELFRAWLVAAREIGEDMRQLRQHHQAEEKHRQELEALNSQLECAIAQANEMAAEASLAYIEINQIFRTVAGGIFLIDTDFEILRYNEALLRMAGVTAAQAEGAKCHEIFPSVLCGTPSCPLRQIKQGAEQVENEIEFAGPDGPAYYHVLATPFRGPAGDLVGIVEHITDVTSRVLAEKALQESEQRYKELSIVDELTGLFNKRYFNQHLGLEVERARRYGQSLALLIMDIDHFKHFNDTYGHPAGDRVLAVMGAMLRDSLRLNDLACRFGGEEFVVILPETDGETALRLADRLRERFATLEFQPREDGEVVRKTMSIGVAQFETDESPEALLERADKNLYQAKEAGRNRSIFK
ncbi:diguanylate cyclase [Desulfurivibrio sp. D14AmB]|uniref:diguanylate cyclase n=1 Tax=Desulfurivibrio sp. D14AmB TaxID=3374370 RepID=UPI00376F3C37